MAKVVAEAFVVINNAEKKEFTIVEAIPASAEKVGFRSVTVSDRYANGDRFIKATSFADEGVVYLHLEEESPKEYWGKIFTPEKAKENTEWLWDKFPIYDGGTATRRQVMDRNEFNW